MKDLKKVQEFFSKPMGEATKEDPTDIIAMDVPLFLRMLEWAKEEAAEDVDLHEVTERAIEAVKLRGLLSMDDYDSLIGETQQVDENALLTESGGIVGALLILFMVMKGSVGAGLVASPIAGLVEYFFHELPAKRLKAKMLKLFKDPTKRQEVLNMAKEVESYLSPGQQRYLKGLVNSIDKKQLEDEISQAYIDIDSYIANKDRMIKRGEWEDYLKREKELADIRRAAAQKAKNKKAKQIKENIESEIASYIKANPIPDNVEELDEVRLIPKDQIEALAAKLAAQIFSKRQDNKPAVDILKKALEDAYRALDPDVEIKEEEGYSKYLKDDPEFPGGKTKGLTPDVLNKILMKIANVDDIDETTRLGEGVIYEELCPKGKAYIKKRMAAGEKSSAYLSGRAVKVCKGQMKG